MFSACTLYSKPDFHEIISNADFSINFVETNILDIKRGMNVDEALIRLRDRGFDEDRLLLRARSTGYPVDYLSKKWGNPPERLNEEDCRGVTSSYGHNYYRNESSGNDVSFSVIQIWQGPMLIDGNCQHAVTATKAVKSYKIKNILDQ